MITGGLAPASNDGDEMSPITFLSELYRYLEPGTADAIAVHPYTFPARPSDSGRSNLFRRLPVIAELVASEEGRPLPIWLTEFGAPTGTSDKAVSPDTQAEIITDAMRCVRGDETLGPLFLYNLADPAGGDPADREDNFMSRLIWVACSEPLAMGVAMCQPRPSQAQGRATPNGQSETPIPWVERRWRRPWSPWAWVARAWGLRLAWRAAARRPEASSTASISHIPGVSLGAMSSVTSSRPSTAA